VEAVAVGVMFGMERLPGLPQGQSAADVHHGFAADGRKVH